MYRYIHQKKGQYVWYESKVSGMCEQKKDVLGCRTWLALIGLTLPLRAGALEANEDSIDGRDTAFDAPSAWARVSQRRSMMNAVHMG